MFRPKRENLEEVGWTGRRDTSLEPRLPSTRTVVGVTAVIFAMCMAAILSHEDGSEKIKNKRTERSLTVGPNEIFNPDMNVFETRRLAIGEDGIIRPNNSRDYIPSGEAEDRLQPSPVSTGMSNPHRR